MSDSSFLCCLTFLVFAICLGSGCVSSSHITSGQGSPAPNHSGGICIINEVIVTSELSIHHVGSADGSITLEAIGKTIQETMESWVIDACAGQKTCDAHEIQVEIVRAYTDVKAHNTFFNLVLRVSMDEAKSRVFRGVGKATRWFGSAKELNYLVRSSIDYALNDVNSWLRDIQSEQLSSDCTS